MNFRSSRLISAMVAMAMVLASCSTYKKINYFQDVETNVSEEIAINKGIIIQPKDMISVVVSSRNPELAAMFNLPVVTYQAGSEIMASANQKLIGYVVDNSGNIEIPVIGTVHAAGLTRWELADLVKSRLLDGGLLTDPVVAVEFLNFKISVIGEVTSPGIFSIDGDRVTLLEALSLAKDMTIFGRRDCVYVIREQDGKRTTYQVDVRSKALFDSPAYYLQQNDVVYVEPNKVRAGQSTINENNAKSISLWVSVGSFLTTIATMITTILLRSGTKPVK